MFNGALAINHFWNRRFRVFLNVNGVPTMLNLGAEFLSRRALSKTENGGFFLRDRGNPGLGRRWGCGGGGGNPGALGLMSFRLAFFTAVYFRNTAQRQVRMHTSAIHGVLPLILGGFLENRCLGNFEGYFHLWAQVTS